MENNKNIKILEILKEDDLDFYEKYLVNLTDEEFDRFLKENPDFFSDLSKH